MDDPSVSVVIPAYKAGRTIGRALDSVFAQTCLPQEVLVVDDGSPEDLSAALRPYQGRVTLVRKPNGGAASARNLGIDRARGELIAFLDADDYWEPARLERQLAVLRRHPEVGLVAGRFYEQKPGGVRLEASLGEGYFGRVLRATGEEAFAVATRIWTGTVLVSRDTVGVRRFESGLEPAEDRDLWIRLAAAVPVYLVSEPLATAVLEPDSLSRSNIDVDCTNMLRVIKRNQALLGPRGLRHWQALTFRRWAANHLAAGRPQAAFRRALHRLRLQPLSLEAWWVVAKCGARACAPSALSAERPPGLGRG
jgi:glycosyltransferase involved in cell wall biosynthesis